MKRDDLRLELRSAAFAVRQPHIDRLKALGVPLAALADYPVHPFGVARVEPVGTGIYQPGEHGAPHYVLPVLLDGELADLVAFQPSDPGNWLLRTGAGWCLGLNEPVGLLTWRDSINLWSTPLDWLRAGSGDLCVLDWDASEAIRTLDVLPHLVCDNRATAERLRRALMPPIHMPKISIREGLARAA